MSTQPKSCLTPEEYLEIEYKAEYKSEYFAGEMLAMVSGSDQHCLITVQASCLLVTQLRSRPCRAYGSDMRILVSETGLYTYPDVSAVCGPSQLEGTHNHTLLNPNLIIEVLSPSTEAYDRGRKFEHYRTIPSLTQYVLIASDRVHADIFTRGNEGVWMLVSASEPGDVLHLTSVDCTMRLIDLYEKTDLIEQAAPSPPTASDTVK
jgi:Uma2 family endonuclease